MWASIHSASISFGKIGRLIVAFRVRILLVHFPNQKLLSISWGLLMIVDWKRARSLLLVFGGGIVMVLDQALVAFCLICVLG